MSSVVNTSSTCLQLCILDRRPLQAFVTSSIMAEEAPHEPLFRSSKRWKVIRNRRDSDDAEEPQEPKTITKQEDERTEDNSSGIMRAQKKSAIRKNGIGFSNIDGRRTNDQYPSQELALAVADDCVEPEAAGSDRFVRPTGNVGVTEDKHMYVLQAAIIKLRYSTNSVGWHM